MSKIEILSGTIRDITYVASNMRERDWEEISAVVPDDWDRWMVGIQTAKAPGITRSVFLNGIPVGSFGVNFTVNPSVCIAWAFGTDKFRRVIPAVSRHIIDEIIPFAEAAGCYRCEVRVREDYEESVKWLEKLGAKVDARLDSYGKDGATYLLMSWTRQKEEMRRAA